MIIWFSADAQGAPKVANADFSSKMRPCHSFELRSRSRCTELCCDG